MSGLNHDFQVIESGTFSLDKTSEYLENDKIEIHDDFLNYLSDSLKWIKTTNPTKKEKEVLNGLCCHGSTIIAGKNVEKFKKIIKAWVYLFENSPSKIRLTGSYSWVVGQTKESGFYEKLCFEKKDILEKLNGLVNLCKIVIKSKGSKCLLHQGI